MNDIQVRTVIYTIRYFGVRNVGKLQITYILGSNNDNVTDTDSIMYIIINMSY